MLGEQLSARSVKCRSHILSGLSLRILLLRSFCSDCSLVVWSTTLTRDVVAQHQTAAPIAVSKAGACDNETVIVGAFPTFGSFCDQFLASDAASE